MLTAYDYPFARVFDLAGIDMLLVGDSLAMVVQGHQNTLPATVNRMIYHLQMRREESAVARCWSATCRFFPIKRASNRPCSTPGG